MGSLGREQASINLEKHGIDFRDAIGIFDGPHLTTKTIRNDEHSDGQLGRVAESVSRSFDRSRRCRADHLRKSSEANERQVFAAHFGG